MCHDTNVIAVAHLVRDHCRILSHLSVTQSKEGKAGLGVLLMLSGACYILCSLFLSTLLLASFLLTYIHLLLSVTLSYHRWSYFRLRSASPANAPHMSVVGPSRHALALS